MPTNAIPLPEPDGLMHYVHPDGRRPSAWSEAQVHAHVAAVSAAKDARIRVLEDALRDVLDRMDRARTILTDGKPRPECNWGILATEAARAALGDKT